MSIFTSAKAKLAAQKLAEEQLYEFAAEEIAANNIRPGLWAKAIAESDGDDAKAKARYIKLRVEAMKAEADLANFAASGAETTNHSSSDGISKGSDNEMAGVFIGVCVVVIIIFLMLFAAISQV